MYRKIPIINPGTYFWSKGLFANFFLGRGGGLIFGGGLYMDEYLRLENAIFCSSNCKYFWDFLLTICFYYWFLYLFIFNNVLATVNTTIKYLLPKFDVIFTFNYSKYWTPGGLFSGELIHGRSFPFRKLVPKLPGLIHSGAYYRNFTV